MQTWALMVDSYRLLVSRKLFWITLAISGVILLVYASVGYDENGMTLLFSALSFEDESLRAGTIFSKVHYIDMFTGTIMDRWLSWGAIILALISTSTIFPDFIANGSIDVVLSKPIGRLKVFFVKYIGAVLFVLLQIAIFCVGAFFCIGLRVGEWNFNIFLAIPLILALFSYLYCINVFLAILTRSMIASLLLTFLFWFVIFGVQTTDVMLNLVGRQMSIVTAERAERDVTILERQLEILEGRSDTNLQPRIAQLHEQVATAKEDSKRANENRDDWVAFYKVAQVLIAITPKTQDTTNLFRNMTLEGFNESVAAEQGESLDQMQANAMAAGFQGMYANDPKKMEYMNEAARRYLVEKKKNGPWYVVGTSLGFEAVVLLITCWIFKRRDF